MRKRVIRSAERTAPPGDAPWLDLEHLAAVEVTSEDPSHPVEAALLRGADGSGGGWRAAEPGEQTIRLVFDSPQRLRRIRVSFSESSAGRTQEFVLRWAPDPAAPMRDVVRQQWTFSPWGATREVEDYRVELHEVGVLELSIAPEVSGGGAVASLEQLRLA